MAFIIPVFIPHEGCPHSCVFCNQHSISGQEDQPISAEDVTATISLWLSFERRQKGGEVQVAFFGGSFTGLALERQQVLLRAVAPFIATGQVDTIRVSTRPDYIDSGRSRFLVDNGVSLVELGVQSLDEQVLRLAVRGHNSAVVENAVGILRENRIRVGMQLMVGLPGQGFTSVRRTVQKTIELKPDCVRIYPVLVVRGSRLEELYGRGEYTPLSLNKAVLMTAYMKKHFDRHAIQVIRMGLQPGKSLEQALVAGPYHPSFGEMVHGRLMFRQSRAILAARRRHMNITLVINPKDTSIFRGIRSVNMQRLAALGLGESFTLKTDPDQPRGLVSFL